VIRTDLKPAEIQRFIQPEESVALVLSAKHPSVLDKHQRLMHPIEDD
jgi:hypothetical protein